MEKVIFDTDIGQDIDDAVCLAYLLANPECELMGITTNFGENEKRAEVASAMVYQSGKDVPVFPGRGDTLFGLVPGSGVPQHRALGALPHQTAFQCGAWLEFMKSAIESNPGQITLLGTGPMTNIGLLLTVYPHLASQIKQLVLMCGKFSSRFPEYGPIEWNAKSDPIATKMVYDAPVAIHRSVGVDVTLQVQMDAREVKKRFTHPVLQPVLQFASVWFERTPVVIFHDPLAAVATFHDDVVTYRRGNVDAQIFNTARLGATDFSENEHGRHLVADTVQPELFFQHFFEVFQ